MLNRTPIGMIKVDNNIIVKNAPVDRKFWDVYLKCCANCASLDGMQLIKSSKRSTYGYHLYFDPIDMTASVVSFRIRLMKLGSDEIKQENHETIQQPA